MLSIISVYLTLKEIMFCRGCKRGVSKGTGRRIMELSIFSYGCTRAGNGEEPKLKIYESKRIRKLFSILKGDK